MKAHILRGTKEEIAESLSKISGDVREVIVLVDELDAVESASVVEPDIFAEMGPYMVEGTDDVDDSREAIYTRMDGE
jgi:hypothetical protein